MMLTPVSKVVHFNTYFLK